MTPAGWADRSVCVAGIGVSGFAAADTLTRLGTRVTVVDRKDGDAERDKAAALGIRGATVLLGAAAPPVPPAGTQLVVTSPGWPPHAPLLQAADRAGIPIWGEVELAWRLRSADAPPWLIVTGTNGKTTTVRMLAAMLSAAGLRASAAGNVGTPLLEIVTGPVTYDAIAVELSSYQLHWSHSLRPHAAAVLNLAPDHVDWHGSIEAYYAAKGRAYERCTTACVYNAADPQTEKLARDALGGVAGSRAGTGGAAGSRAGTGGASESCRAVGFTLGVPDMGMVGVAEGVLVDRAFVAERRTSAAVLASVTDVVPNAPHNVANALAAAALARSLGVPPQAVRDGLRAFTPQPHRIAPVGDVSGVTYVDDSKATNPHAAAASLGAFDRVIWLAGGQAKGTSFDDLVRDAAGRLRGVVLFGQDRATIGKALARHAPDVPVVDVAASDTEVMDRVVREAARLASPGDTVLLAPGCASLDMFTNYADRGDRFAAAVARLRSAPNPGA